MKIIAAIPGFIMYFWLVFALIAYFPARQDLKLHEYNDGARIIAEKTSLAALTPIFPLTAAIIIQINVGKPFQWMNLLFFIMVGGSGGLIALMGSVERKIVYTSLSNKQKRPAPINAFLRKSKT